MNLKDKTVVIDNKTYRYSKIVILPCFYEADGNFEHRKYPCILKYRHLFGDKHSKLIFVDCNIRTPTITQHLYFLSTDKICEGDEWWMYVNLQGKCLFPVTRDGNTVAPDDLDLRIIASTDSSLNLPKPSDSFLQVYIDAYNKNEQIEECLIEYEEILGDEGVLAHTFKEDEFKIKVTKGEITIRKVKESWTREEVKELCKSAFITGSRINDIDYFEWEIQNL